MASKGRGRCVLITMAVMCVMYVPLWFQCRMPAPIPLAVLDHHASPSTDRVAQVPCPVAVKTPSLPPLKPPVALAPRDAQPQGVYHMRIVVFTYRRLEGLKRLLESLRNAWYLGHDVSLTIYVDFPKSGMNKKAKRPNTIRDDDGTREYVSNYQWPHGLLTVHRRLVNAGLKHTIMESWFPSANSSEVTAFFEDDIEVSPLWYAFATRAIAKYAPARRAPTELLGISLFRPIHDELSGQGCVVDAAVKAFALQQPCSWGAVFLPGAWRAFRDWYDDFNADGVQDAQVVLQDGESPTSNTWDHKSSWKKYLIKLMAERGWYMVYPNAPHKTVLSTNHLMQGEHPTPRRDLFELPLLMPNSADAQAFLATPSVTPATVEAAMDRILPPLRDMKAYDVLFRPVDHIASLPKSP